MEIKNKPLRFKDNSFTVPNPKESIFNLKEDDHWDVYQNLLSWKQAIENDPTGEKFSILNSFSISAIDENGIVTIVSKSKRGKK